MEVRNSSFANGADVAQWDDANILTQQWYIYDKGNGWHEFVNANSGKALDVTGGKTANGTNVQQFERNNTDAQRFRLISNNIGTDVRLTVSNNGSGDDAVFSPGNYPNMVDIRGKDFNDKASCIEVPNGAGAVVFTEAGFGGSYRVFLPGQYNLESTAYSGLNKNISSIRVLSESDARDWKSPAAIVTVPPAPTPSPQPIEPEIIQAYPKQGTVTSGDTVSIYVKSNDIVDAIELINERGEVVAASSVPMTNRNGEKEWNFGWGTRDAGNRSLKIRAYVGSRYTDYTISVTVNEPVSTMTIYSIAVANSTVKVGDYCWMTVVTSADISDLWIVNETKDTTVYQLVRSYSVGSNKGWDIGWQLGQSGYRTGYIVASNGNKTISMPFECIVID